MSNVSSKTKNIAKMGILAAISVVLIYLVHFPVFPAVPFLEYDPADIPILLGTFAMGPLEGFLLTVAASLIQGLTVSAQSGFYGILMHIIATGSYVIAAGTIYKRNKTKKSAIRAMATGCLVWVLVMIPANLIITPLFTGAPVGVIVNLLPWIISFNIIKCSVNSLITFLLYKRVSPILHK